MRQQDEIFLGYGLGEMKEKCWVIIFVVSLLLFYFSLEDVSCLGEFGLKHGFTFLTAVVDAKGVPKERRNELCQV